MDGRRTLTSEERQQETAISKTLKVSNYLDEIIESIHTGAPPKIRVPNFKEPTKGEIMNAAQSNTPLPHESGGNSMSFDSLYKMAGIDVTPTPQEDLYGVPETAPSAPDPSRPTCTQNQWKAIKKYPGLIEFLGQRQGEKIARQISEQVNIVLAEVIQENSQETNEHAVVCKANGQNLKQYFQGDDWICRVTASGPFCEEDAIFYSREQDVALVLRRSGVKGSYKYANMSSRFNIIFEASALEKQADTELEEKDEEVVDTIPAPADSD